MSYRSLVVLSLFIIFIPALVLPQSSSDFNGQWALLPEKSSEIGLYGTLSIDLAAEDHAVTIIQTWGTSRSFSDTIRILTDGQSRDFPIRDRVFPTNVFMGLAMPVGGTRQISAHWEPNRAVLKLECRYDIRGSQGYKPVVEIHTYQLADSGEVLVYRIERSTRPASAPLQYLLKRAGSRQAYVMRIEDDWEVAGGLDRNALLLSLQGNANRSGPNLYFIYPENWPFVYTASLFDYYRQKRNYTFTELQTIEQALDKFKKDVRGYVVWDKSVRTSLIVAFTVAGLDSAVVVSPELIYLVDKAGLKMIEDFRGRFTGKSDYDIYRWAYDRYWHRCNKQFIVWLGGDAGKIMKPGVADWGIYKQVFFQDLSTRETDTLEYRLANRLLSEMQPGSIVMGWHSYAKDRERDHVKLTSKYGHVVEGLHTLPNFSFDHQIPFAPGFKIKNNHHIISGKEYKPAKKVYLTCIQSDGMGIGAWLRPGRGEIPYAWEMIMNYVWLAPVLLEYFYTMATPNDYFIGCLSGPGYMYPKAVPPALLPGLLRRANDLMKQLDLRVFEIMDYSEGATVEGNTELTREVVDAYYNNMPEAIGFVNGYAPAYTFTNRDGRPLISYDYYLSPTIPEAEAVADLQELARINSARPYFLLIHVRESSDVKRVKGILDRLGKEFEVVPLDIFLKMAGHSPTFKEKFLTK
ncbi:MAG: GxGYxYP family putative glycoside hydrolase [candidate division KSB1 bacterium]|nr:GxGYxYP family putative glycoside hydrolase [candidate division KSB1 bacterium]